MPDMVTGMTILAIGSSITQIITTICMTLTKGIATISQTISLCIYNTLICLGLPWFIKTVWTPPYYIQVYSGAIVYSSSVLLGGVLAFLLILMLNGWKLSFKLGIYFLILWGFCIAVSCLSEYNVFGFVNTSIVPSLDYLHHHLEKAIKKLNFTNPLI